MKPDGETMETKEPVEAAAVAEPASPQEGIREQAPSQPEGAANDAAAPKDAPKADGKSEAAHSKTKPRAVASKIQPAAKPTGVSGSHSRSDTASQRTRNDVKSSNSVSAAAVNKTSTAAKSSSAAGAIPKRPVGVAAVSATIKSQTRMPDKRPVGQARTTSAAASTVTNGTKPTKSVNNAAKKRPGAEGVGARPKTTASTCRPTASTAPKPSTSTTAKAGTAAAVKTTRPATAPLTSRPAPTSSRPTAATTKPPTSAAFKTSASRATTASSTGWMSAAQLPRTVAAKKDNSRPASAAVTKKPATATTSAATRKHEPSKPAAPIKTNSASKLSTTAKAADPKVSQSKAQQPTKSAPVKKPSTPVRFPAPHKTPLAHNSCASPAKKPASCATSQAKCGTRPTQAVFPFTANKRAGVRNTTAPAVDAQSAAGAAVAAATPSERRMEATVSLPHAASFAITPDVVPEETPQNFAAASSPPQNPVRTSGPRTPPPQEHLESSAPMLTTQQQTAVADEPRLPPVAAATAVTVAAERQMEATLSFANAASSAPEEVLAPVLAQDTTLDIVPEVTAQNLAAASSPLQNLVRTTGPQTPSPHEHLESSAPVLATQQQTAVADEPRLPPAASPPDPSEEPVYVLTDQTPSTSKVLPAAAAANAIPQIAPFTNLNEEDDEEEREGSQLVSVSEMSGTTQPTEESRPGSGGPVGGSAWRAGGALLSELDSEEVSGSHQGASELSAPGVLEGTESIDDLGDGSLKGAIDMEGASAGSPDFEKVPDIPVNDFDEDEDEDDEDDRVCDMDVGSERADEPQRLRHDNDVDDDEEEDEDVEMASEGVTESGLESYGNADEDDFVEDERLDNLNRVAQPPPPPPLLPSAPAAQWDQPNPFADPWAELFHPLPVLEHVALPSQVEGAAAESPLKDPWQADSETPSQTQAQAWLEVGSGLLASENEEVPHRSAVKDEPQNVEVQMYRDESGTVPMQTLVQAPLSAPGMSPSSTLSSETSTPEDLGDCYQDAKFQPRASPAAALSSQPELDYQGLGVHTKRGNVKGEEEEAMFENLPSDDVLGGAANAPTSNPSSSSSGTEDEASDTEGEAQLDDSLESPLVINVTFDKQPAPQRFLSTVEEGEEADMGELEGGADGDATPPSATSLASCGFDTMTTASNSNAQSTGESSTKSPGIFSLEDLPEESRGPCGIPQPHTEPRLSEQQYIECGKLEEESHVRHVSDEVQGPEEAPDPSSTPSTLQQPEENPDDNQPPYYSAICEKTENSFSGFTALLHPHRRDHTAHPRTDCDVVKPHGAAVSPPKLTCADLPPRNLGRQALSPQLRRLEQHQRQLLELQQRREQQGRPLEEAEQERKRREEEEQRRKKEEAEEEIKRNKEEVRRKMQEQAAAVLKEEEEELRQREHLELQLQQQQQELMKWQPELQQGNKGQMVLLSPSSGLCTIYEALENSDEEEVADEEKVIRELEPTKAEPGPDASNKVMDNCETVTSDEDGHQDSSPSADVTPPISDSSLTHGNPPQDGESSSPVSPEPSPPPLDLDWGKKVDIVQQLINQTLLLNRDGCSSLLLLPGGAGGTLSPLESSLWPSMLPPLTPPSATVTAVSSFSPEATGSSPQGEWTVVELETHH